jgi:hypothetical protein
MAMDISPSYPHLDNGEETPMQTPTFPAIQSKSFNEQGSDQTFSSAFLNIGSVAEVARSPFFSSIPWMVLAAILCGVYSLALG